MTNHRAARAHRAFGSPALTIFMALVAMLTACGGDSAVAPVAAPISISPTDPVVALAESVKLVANLDGAPAEASTVHWSSADPKIATVDEGGLVTGRAVGTVRIAASARGLSAETSVRVTPPRVTRVEVVPAATSLSVGDTTAVRVTAYGSDGQQLTGRAVSVVSETPTTVAVIEGPRAVALAAGAARIVATAEGVSGSANITVSAAAVATVELLPESLTLSVGGTARLVAVARDRSGAALSGRKVTFTSATPAVATVTGDGTVTAVAPGRAEITAAVEGVSARTVVTVPTAAAAQLTVTPASATLLVGETVRLEAVLRDPAGKVLTGRAVTWRSTNTDAAQVSAAGVVTATGVGVAVVVASSEGLSASVGITVVRAPVAAITLTPTKVALTVGGVGQLTASPRDAQGAVVPDVPISWTSSAPAIATVSSTGEVRALAAGSATITASGGGKTATAAVTVSRAPVATVTLDPSSLALRVGASGQLTATARDASGATVSGASFTWTSSDPAVATVSATGKVNALTTGSATVTATSEGKSASAAVTVSPPTVAELTVDPTALALTVGESQTLVATARDANGAILSGATVSWTSSAPAVASVSSSGTVTALAAGSAAITATSDGKAASAAVTVSRPPVASVTVTPSALTLEAGASGQLTAAARDAGGAAVTDAAFTWLSSDEAVATVSSTGQVRAQGAGVATVTATSGDASGSSTVTVQAAAEPAPTDSTPSEPPVPGAPSKIVIVSGDGQVGTRRETLANPLVVRVLDAADVPVPNVAVLWIAENGGLAIPEALVTAADGTSSARWQLGAGSGDQKTTAAVLGVGSVTFHATSVKP